MVGAPPVCVTMKVASGVPVATRVSMMPVASAGSGPPAEAVHDVWDKRAPRAQQRRVASEEAS